MNYVQAVSLARHQRRLLWQIVSYWRAQVSLKQQFWHEDLADSQVLVKMRLVHTLPWSPVAAVLFAQSDQRARAMLTCTTTM